MTRWGLAIAAVSVALAVWGCVVLARMMRPMYVFPRDAPPLMAVARLDTLEGHPYCQVEYRLIRVDR